MADLHGSRGSWLRRLAVAVFSAFLLSSIAPAQLPDGLYAQIRTSKGLIVARLEADLTPITVANFVGLAEGTIANSAFDPGRPFFDGTTWHRVVPGHVIQAGIPKSDRSRGPGYDFPNEIHSGLSHNHAGALNMANSGPNTNSSQFCIMLGDRSYLDGDFTVFGEVVQGLDVVMRIVQGDAIESVRILRIGAKAEAFRPTTESFRAQVKAAEQRVADSIAKRRAAEHDWIARNYPKATGPDGGVLTETLSLGQSFKEVATRFRYRGRELRYKGLVMGYEGAPIATVDFVSNSEGAPIFDNAPHSFVVESGKTKFNPGLDAVMAGMHPGDRRIVIVPPDKGYGRAGLYPPEIQGKPRFVVSPNSTLVYEIEALAQD